ncbi:MAG: LLM class flavin-dependent oxidoreductase [Thaumarchaeota archaeon]|nr:LLM class flavin-dependent oxidoreductase [Nitrososphaerota archaeon]
MALFSLAFEGDKRVDLYRKLAERMEGYNFYSMQIYEHIPFKPSWPIVFHIAKYTKRMLLGPVTIPVFLYDPLTLARNLAVLDELTHGRAMLGISRGAYGEYFGREIDRSVKAVLNCVRAVDGLLRGDRDAGEVSSAERAKPSWLRGTRAKILVGTSGPVLASRASKASSVDGIVVDNLWNPSYAKVLRGVIDAASTKRKRRERVQLIARPFTLISKDKSDAERKMIPILKAYLPHLVANSPMLRDAGLAIEDLATLGRSSSDARIEKLAAMGSVDDIVEQTEKMLKAGVDHVCYGHPLRTATATAPVVGELTFLYSQWENSDRLLEHSRAASKE